MSMTQKYKDDVVYAPGTVIVSAVGEVSDVKKVVEPVLAPDFDSVLLYVDLSGDKNHLGGSSFAQVLGQVGTKAPQVTNPKAFAKGFNYVQKLIKAGKILAGHDVSAGGLITALLEMTFARPDIGVAIDLRPVPQEDGISLLFSEKPGIILQVKKHESCLLLHSFHELGLGAWSIGKPKELPVVAINLKNDFHLFLVEKLRNQWYKTSYLLDAQQTEKGLAKERFLNYHQQPLRFLFPKNFAGQYEVLGLNPDRSTPSGIKAAIIREKGVNGDREMAYAMHLAGFDVKDIHMTDLIAGREDLSDVNFIAFVGGFSNSDVLGSAKGWAGAFLYNEKAKQALDNFYARKDTLSLGICNGCQLMGELGLLYPEHEEHPKLKHNHSGKFESGFVSMRVPENSSVMLGSLSGSTLGIWVAHGEGRFVLPEKEDAYHIVGKYAYENYPAAPNGSDYHVAGLCSADGRHLAIMPHFERSIFPWNWAHYPEKHKKDLLSPWILGFMNAKFWVKKHQGKG